MLIPELPRRSWIVRAGVAAGFIVFSGAVLLAAHGVSHHRDQTGDGDGHSFLILTREPLRPAFESLGEWIQEDGGSSVLFTMESIHAWPGTGQLDELRRICLRHGYDRVILGGDETLVDEASFRQLEAGSTEVLRASCSNLDEAYAVVAAWRAAGIPFTAGPDVAGESGADPVVVDPVGLSPVPVPASPGGTSSR